MTTMKRGRTGSLRQPRVSSTMSIEVDNSCDVNHRIEHIYREGFMADVVLVVGEQDYPAHRLILCSCSLVFEAMFSARWKGEQQTRFELKETASCETVFKLFLQYIYTGKIKICISNVLPLLLLADKYGVEALVTHCTCFMKGHIPQAVTSEVFLSWLQYFEPAGHRALSNQCRNFALFNIGLLKNCKDLDHLEPEMLIDLLQQNNLVVESELDLFQFVVKWLETRNVGGGNLDLLHPKNEEELNAEENLVKSVMEHIRFPMMELHQLEGLNAVPLVTQYKDYFMRRLGVGMSYQSGQQEQANRLVHMINGSHASAIFTPRFFMANTYSLQFEMEELNKQPRYVTRTYCFSSRTFLSAEGYPRDESYTDWVIDFYPRGVYFDKFFVIVWQGLLECPERKKNTVRMRLTCQGPHFPLVVKVGICVYKTVGTLEHISSVTEKFLTFDQKNNVRNIDDIIGYNELSKAVLRNEIVNLKIRLIIMPIDKYCTSESESTEGGRRA